MLRLDFLDRAGVKNPAPTASQGGAPSKILRLFYLCLLVLVAKLRAIFCAANKPVYGLNTNAKPDKVAVCGLLVALSL